MRTLITTSIGSLSSSIVALLVLSACGDSGGQPAKKEVSKIQLHRAKAEAKDLCAEFELGADCDVCADLGYYADGLCDADLVRDGICTEPDPDCSGLACVQDSDCANGEVCVMTCPFGGDCVGECVAVTVGCNEDGDCAPGERCMIAPDQAVGTCVGETSSCQHDSDCTKGEVCQIYCGNGWCDGQCVPTEPPECQQNSDCATGQVCQTYCGNGWCDGICVDVQAGCTSDDDCASGEHCVPSPDEPVGMCVPDSSGCDVDSDCASGEQCQIYCGNGWCAGICDAYDFAQ